MAALPDQPTSASELNDRYARLNQMNWWDQRRVSEARVLIAGAGAIGNEVIKLLALSGVHNLTIVDFDKIELTNLTRSILFRESDVAKSKSVVAAYRAREIDPESRAIGIEGDIEFDIGLGIYRSMDAVIGCLDSINARLALNRACLHAGVPWLNGGIEDVFGEVSLYAGSAACFECGMTDSMWNRRNIRFSCGGQRISIPADGAPTTAIAASIIAGYLVNEVLLLFHSGSLENKEGMRPGQKIVISLKPYDFQVVDLTKNPSCTAHEQWSPVHALHVRPDKITTHELLTLTDSSNDVVEIGYDLLTEMTCVKCGATQEILLPVEKSNAALTVCPHCGDETRRPTTVSWIDRHSPLAHMPLSALQIPQHQIVAVNGAGGRKYYQLGGDNF